MQIANAPTALWYYGTMQAEIRSWHVVTVFLYLMGMSTNVREIMKTTYTCMVYCDDGYKLEGDSKVYGE